LKVAGQLEQIEANHLTFSNTMKDEMEQYTESQRKQNLETLGLMKGVSATVKKLKEAQQSLREDEMKIRDTFQISV